MVGPQAGRSRSAPWVAPAILALVWLALVAPAAGAARLCMLPGSLPFAEDDERRDQLERIVTRHFEAQSIAIIPSAEVEPLLEEVDGRSGAIFDPATGRVDAARDAIYRDDVERSVGEKLGCTGFVKTSLQDVLVWYNGGSVSWDGRTTQINSNPRIAAQVALSVLAGVYISEQGWVPALSLWIRVLDLRFEDVAFRSAGVEPLMDFSLSRNQDLLPEDRWLRDEKIVEEAVASALGPDLSALKATTVPGVHTDAKSFSWE